MGPLAWVAKMSPRALDKALKAKKTQSAKPWSMEDGSFMGLQGCPRRDGEALTTHVWARQAGLIPRVVSPVLDDGLDSSKEGSILYDLINEI